MICYRYWLPLLGAWLATVAGEPVSPSNSPEGARLGLTNEFFAFCMDTHDAAKRSLPEQARLLRELGFDGAGHLWLDQLNERLATLDAVGLKLHQVYLRVDLDPNAASPFDPRLEEAISLLRGRSTSLAVLVTGGKPSDPAGDPRAVEVLQTMARWAANAGLAIALYPHAGDWLERLEDALRLARKIDRPNVGVMFNLCHWIKTDGVQQNLEALLRSARPHLLAVSLNGGDRAEDLRSGKGRWITPLDTGDYDLRPLLALLRELDYRGPIGLQCYGIPGDAREHLQRSMAAWRELRRRLEPLPAPSPQ
jgi:sugar phosphate isomerase/epimerase